jgi:hypothetical protein
LRNERISNFDGVKADIIAYKPKRGKVRYYKFSSKN